MSFNSWEFAALVPITLAVYYALPRRTYQLLVLLAASASFYGWHQPALLALLAFSIAVNALTSYWILYGESAQRRFWAAVNVVANLALLIFFKYSALLYCTLVNAGANSDPVAAFLFSLPLPLGISFFTFQGISLAVDAYRGNVPRPHGPASPGAFAAHALRVAAFKSFFPQLISGPIVKSREFLPQIDVKRRADIDWEFAARSLLLGYFFKNVVADQLKEQTTWLTQAGLHIFSTPTLLTMLFGYSMQIFADFAGYSLIALGIGALFGYRLPINFAFPYLAQSLSDFWRRWHISLSTWLREYLYIPLGGNRRGTARTYANLMIVMVLGGLWHGAAWTFALWGAWHGIGLALERSLGLHRPMPFRSLPVQLLRMLVVFSFVTAGWLLFKFPDLQHVRVFLSAVRSQTNLVAYRKIILAVVIYSLPVIAYHVHAAWCAQRGATFSEAMQDWIYATLLFLILVSSGLPGTFIYFQF